MIDRASIMAWSEFAPWTDLAMVEQDLIICRALVDIFSDDFLKEQLAFRGGTALHKQFVQNMELKLQDPEFLNDTDILLRTDANKFDPKHAYTMVKEAFIDKMSGKRE